MLLESWLHFSTYLRDLFHRTFHFQIVLSLPYHPPDQCPTADCRTTTSRSTHHHQLCDRYIRERERERERERMKLIYIYIGLLMNSTTISVLRYCSLLFLHQNIDPDAQCFSGFSYYFGKMLVYLACYECSYTTHQFAKTIPLFAKLPIVRTSNKITNHIKDLVRYFNPPNNLPREIQMASTSQNLIERASTKTSILKKSPKQLILHTCFSPYIKSSSSQSWADFTNVGSIEFLHCSSQCCPTP